MIAASERMLAKFPLTLFLDATSAFQPVSAPNRFA